MTDRPLFTIVIPTRNRGHLLRYALRSAFAQTFEDFEVVVSNNCSTDDTAAVIAEFASPKLRVVGPQAPLSMPDHWEFALQFPRGEYVTYLCDDDALTPDALEKTAAVIRQTGATVLAGPYLSYFAPTWLDETRRNMLFLLRTRGGHEVFDSRESLRGVFSCRISHWTPRMLNSFTRHDVLEKALQIAGGRLFIQSPDFSFAVFILNAVPSWVMIDHPLRVYGVVKEAVGASSAYTRDSPVLGTFLAEFGEDDLLQRVPLRRPLTVNYVTDAILAARERAGPAMAGIDIDRVQYFVENWKDIRLLARSGTDVRADLNAFEEALALESGDVRRDVRAATTSHTRRALRTRLLPQQGWFRRRAFQAGLVGSVLLKGEQWGFHDIVECADWLARDVSFGLR